MAQRRSLAWTELKVGLLVIAAFGTLAFAIVRIGGQTSLFGEKATVTAYFPSAGGLKEGGEVWLDGILVGNVTEVRVNREPTIPGRVAAVMSIDAAYMDHIRKDSEIGIGSIGLLGDKNIQIVTGTGEPVGDNGILVGEEAEDIGRIIQGTNDIVANFNELSSKLTDLFDTIDQGEGTLGKLLKRSDIHDHLNETVMEMERLVSDIRTGPGTAGKLITDDELYRRMAGIMTSMENVVMKIDRGDGTAARILNDPALYDRMERLLGTFEDIAASIERGDGTLGKLVKDDSLYNGMVGTMTKVDSLVEAIGSGEGTTGKLINDPSLFNTMSQAASEVQKLLYDIKQDPKKYLSISIRLF
jgi:phospholipid/cholesterol/gamma-HCH transport system substrate-binding protein